MKSSTEKLIEIGQACVDWYMDTGSCHFCDVTIFLDKTYHADDCWFYQLLGKDYFDNLENIREVLDK